jgi:hypothetical protein
MENILVAVFNSESRVRLSHRDRAAGALGKVRVQQTYLRSAA